MNQQTGRVLRRVAVGLAILLPLLGATSVEEPLAKVPELSRQINTFSVAMLRQYAGRRGGAPNAILSPQSVYHGLAMW